ncbi:hypothetical protein P280DRAFT_517986 [Massarina eburnea CBS 473.64]|uniref:Uncharacterized protein n=1 Tax=Massarina eburnea CBS 473.64 TaxID=1395130 RepID=A0A6A6S0A9_9PLEO|nr:hypothetical protein P280DRAFT_517986 [Massarina eburnea CBS 473.64]
MVALPSRTFPTTEKLTDYRIATFPPFTSPSIILDPTLPNRQSIMQNTSDIQRKQSIDIGPPVPPKEHIAASGNTKTLAEIRQRRPLPLLKIEKPLPSAPAIAVSKPLPVPPSSRQEGKVNYRTTLLWIGGFAVWFLLVVVLLPVIMERDAMPGFNRFLRQKLHSLIALINDRREKDKVQRQ